MDELPEDLLEELGEGRRSSPRPQQRPYGVEALMRDNSGNWLVLVEPREFTLADFEGFRDG